MTETLDESKRNRRTAKRILAVGLPLVLIGSVGLGYAYWTSSGSGNGSATTANPLNNLTFTDNAPSGLAPGIVLPAGITVTVKNNATNAVHLATVTVAKLSVTQIPTPPGPCGVSDYTLGGTLAMTPTSPVPGGGVDIAPGGTADFSGANVVFNNTSANQDGCKGAPLVLTYTAA